MKRCAQLIVLGITILVAMAGCGGGGDAAPDAQMVSGVASSGAAYSGIVTLKDAKGRQLTYTTTTTGAFTFDVTHMTAPYILKAGTLYAVATTTGTTNINPFTNVIARSATGSSVNLDTVFANISSNRTTLTGISTNLQQAATNFNTAMNQKDASGMSIYTKYGMATPPDFMHGKITIDQDVDKLFADIHVSISGSTVTVTNKAGSAPLVSGSYSVSSGVVSFTVTPNFTNINSLPGIPILVTITPTSATVTPGGSKTFAATVNGTSNTKVTWSVVETSGGSITSSGVYTAPTTAGTYHVKATSAADTTKSATATVTVAAATQSATFPIGTWIGPHGASFTVTKLGKATPGLNYYAGSITYPSFGTVSFSGNPSALETSQILLGSNFTVNANIGGGTSFTVFAFLSNEADLSNIPNATSIRGNLIVTSSLSGYSYNETAIFVKQ